MRNSTSLLVSSLLFVISLLVLVQSGVIADDGGFPVQPVSVNDYPPDPTSDIIWTGSGDTVSVIEAQFNRARSTENTQLSAAVQPLTMPSQAVWDAMDDGHKALWLINKERVDRGLKPLDDVEKNVTQVAQAYAEWLLANNAWGHTADGKDPYQRLNANTAINACHDFLGVSENLYVTMSTYSAANRIAIERAIYYWMYEDSAHDWGHRHALLWTPFTDNSGVSGKEGFIGVGHARGAYTYPSDPSQFRWPNADMIVLNLFDPCATWQYAIPPTVAPPPTPQPAPTPVPTPNTASVSGNVQGPTWIIIEQQPFEPTTWPGKWQVSDADGATNGEYYWTIDNCQLDANSGISNGMAVGGGADGSKIASCLDRYPNNARSWMIYGPFSLSDAIQAELRAKVWVHTEPYVDELCLLASVDRRTFNGPCISGTTTTTANPNGWVEELLDMSKVVNMGSLLGRANVYVALAFVSDETENRTHLGAFADNLVLRKGVISASAIEQADAASVDAASPLAGVRITDESGNWVLTSADGSFTLSNLSRSLHRLTPSKDGYTFYPPTMTVDLSQGNVTAAAFVGGTSNLNRVYVPGIRRQSNAVAAEQAYMVTEESFVIDCSESGCKFFGPLNSDEEQ